MEYFDDDPLFDDLPEDPQEAFLILERRFWLELNEVEPKSQLENYQAKSAYITKVLASIKALELKCDLAERVVPNFKDCDEMFLTEFKNEVEQFRTTVRIQRGRYRKQYSVALDHKTKAKLRRLLDEMKQTVDKLDVSDSKKEALFEKIGALEKEIHRDRTRFEVVSSLWLEVCSKAGEGAEKLKPLRDLCDSIGKLIGHAKSEEPGTAPRLPHSDKPKQIEGPKADPDTSTSEAGEPEVIDETT